MECAQCGTAVPEEASFCHSCGSQVSDAEGQARVTASMDMSSLQHMEKLLKDDTKGEFEIGDLLGRGGMAMVYLATEVHLSRKVAIKVLPPELTFGHGVERFKREAKTAAGLDHPNIIPIYRIASGGKVFWYAMKFLEGQSLDEMLKEKGRCSLQETIQILMPVADALDYGHLHSVIHRDIKPANIMLDAQNRVTVTDFGIAKALTEGTLTASGSVIGTPFYMSPEQGMGKPVTGAADQYSVAVMTYRMLSGQVPFEGDSAIDILHKHCTILPPPLDMLSPGLPDFVYKAVEKGLAKKPGERFSTVKAFVKALREPSPEITLSEAATVAVDSDPSILSGAATEMMSLEDTPTPHARSGTQAPPVLQQPTATPTAPPPKRKLWKILLPLLIVIGAGVGGGGWWWMNQQQVSQADNTQSETTVAQTSESTQQPEEVVGDTTTTPGEAVSDSVPPEPPPPENSQVSVTGLPRGGVVRVNGERQASSTFELAPGTYDIAISAPGYIAYDTPIDVSAGTPIVLPFTGQRAPRPRPQQTRPQNGVVVMMFRPGTGVDLFIDGQPIEQATTRYVGVLTAGRHTVRIQAAGHITLDTAVTVVANDTTELRLRMQRENDL